MTSLASLVDPTLVERLGWTLVHSLWQGVLIAAVSGILFFALRGARAQTRYLAACASLLLVVASAAITFSMIAPASAAPQRHREPHRQHASTSSGSVAASAAAARKPRSCHLRLTPRSTGHAPASQQQRHRTAAAAARATVAQSTATTAPIATQCGVEHARPLPLAVLDAYQRATIGDRADAAVARHAVDRRLVLLLDPSARRTRGGRAVEAASHRARVA